MRNWLLILLITTVIGIVGWQFKQREPAFLGLDFELPENLSTDSDLQTASSEANAVAAPVSEDPKEILKTLAFRITERPIVISAQLNDATKKLATEKLRQTVVYIKQEYDLLGAWYDLGAYRKLIGDYEGAAEAWTFATLIRPKDYIGYHNLGDLYGFYIKDYPKSEENYFKSIQNNPQNVQAYLDLATIYQFAYKEKANQVESVLSQGLRDNPNSVRLQSALDDYHSSK